MQRIDVESHSPNIIISSALIALISFFFVFSAGTYFEADIYPLEDRQTIQKTFQTFVFSQFVDSLIISISTIVWFGITLFGKARVFSILIYGTITLAAIAANISSLLDIVTLVSIPAIVATLIYNKFSNTKILNGSTNFTLAVFAIFGLGLGLLSLSISFFKLVNFTSILPDYAFQIFVLISTVSPMLIFFLVFGYPIKLLLLKSIKKLKSKPDLSQQKLNSKTIILYLTLFVALSVVIVLISHNPEINPENQLVGADSADYARWISDLKSFNGEEFLYQVFFAQSYGDRSLSLLLFSPIAQTVEDSSAIATDHLPLILSPLLVLVVFYFTRELTSNDITSLFASFLTAISFHTLIGVYAGLYANWLALIFGYLSFVFLIKFLKLPTKRNYIIFSILLFLILFSHVYTWTILIFFMIVFLLVTYKLKSFERKNIILIGIILAASIAVDITKSTLTDSVGGIDGDISIANKLVSTENTSIIWDNLIESIHVFAGGQFSNILILLLCVYWIIRSSPNSNQNIFIGVFFSIAILPILFGNYIVQTRVLFDIPFQIPAAIALTYFFNRPFGKLIIVAICIAIFAMAVKSVSNFI